MVLWTAYRSGKSCRLKIAGSNGFAADGSGGCHISERDGEEMKTVQIEHCNDALVLFSIE